MRKFNFGIVVVLFAGLIAGTASAADFEKLMTVNVPFAFEVGKDTLPAGAYEILGLSGRNVMWIKSQNGAKVGFASTIPTRESKYTDNSALVFTRYGDNYFLSKVLLAGQHDSKVLRKSQREIELAQLAQSGKTSGVRVVAAANR